VTTANAGAREKIPFAALITAFGDGTDYGHLVSMKNGNLVLQSGHRRSLGIIGTKKVDSERLKTPVKTLPPRPIHPAAPTR
jgi:hypothetical protein